VSAVLLVGHHERPLAGELGAVAARWLVDHGHEPFCSPVDAESLGLRHLASERAPGDAALALSIGGDGTMLRTVALLDGAPTPIIGVNVGLLGYLTAIEPPELVESLRRFFAGEVELEERMLLAVEVARSDGRVEHRMRALNEASLEKREAGHTVRMRLHIDGEPFTTYQADGLIVATPTGSTAYSLSARGPVVSPRHRAILVTPVSPHQLFDRSLVLDPEEPVDVEVLGHRAVDLAVDGRRTATLHEGDVVRCRAAAEAARFVRLGPSRFHQILKSKFQLGDR
jgi:NAD+ kinase